jgi:hypothetical protein
VTPVLADHEAELPKPSCDCSQVANMGNLLRDTDLNPDITRWNVSSVTNLFTAFSGNPTFNQGICSPRPPHVSCASCKHLACV